MNYSTEQEDYLMTTPYTKKIQRKFEKVKNFLEKNGFNSSSQGLMQDIISSQEYLSKNDLWYYLLLKKFKNNKTHLLRKVIITLKIREMIS